MATSSTSRLTPEEFESLIQTIRPELHRYATRMVGSAIDGEDVVQEALIKAHAALPMLSHETHLRGWLFRITHNKAIDLLRRNSHAPLALLDEVPMNTQPDEPLEEQELAALALSMFLKLPPRQRSCVILKDVLGYSLAEVSEHLDATVPEIKATLHRGRTRLRALALDVESATPNLSAHEHALLSRYVDRFNARDFDSLRTMLAEEVQLDLVGRIRLTGADEIRSRYYHQYQLADRWRLAVGIVEDRPALLGFDLQGDSAQPAYFMLLTYKDDRVTLIRDYLYAPHVLYDTTHDSTIAP